MTVQSAKKAIALAGATVMSAGLLVACGNSLDGTWEGTGQDAETGVAAGKVTLKINGGDCEWMVTNPDTNESDTARCEVNGDDLKLADVITGKDLKYKTEQTENSLTLTPDGGDAKDILVLTKVGE